MINFSTKDAYSYFRMGLVTGIVDKQAMIEWADNEIVQDPIADHEVIELSLSGNRSYSHIIWTLRNFEGQPDYGLALNLLLARAGILFEENPGCAGEIIMGLRLLNEEEYFPKGLKLQITELKGGLELYEQGLIPFEDVSASLKGFLAPYAAHRPLLCRTVHRY